MNTKFGPSPSLKIAVIGPGLVGATHARIIEESQGMDLAAVVSPSCHFKSDTNAPNFQSIAELLSKINLDGAVIASPTEFHFTHAHDLIVNSIPVLIEKPVGHSAEQVIKLQKLAKEYSVPVCVGHHRVHGRLFNRLRAEVEKGDLGDCHFALAKTIFKKPELYFATKPWRKIPENGGVVGINLVHDIDIMQRLLGQFSSVFADLIFDPIVTGLPVAGKAICNSKTSSCVFLFSDKTASADSWEMTSGENPYFHNHSGNCYEFFFENGSLKFPDFLIEQSGCGGFWTDEFTKTKNTIEVDDPLVNQIQNFREVILGKKCPEVSLSDAIQNRYVLDAIFESSKKKKTVLIGVSDAK